MPSFSTLCATALLGLTSISAAQAADLAFAVGSTGESTMTYRFGVQCDFERNFSESETGRFTGYWDTAYTYWQGDKTASNNSLSLTPVFVYEFAGETIKPYVEAGIGVAFFSDTELEDNKLGSSFQFEDRIGFGVRFAGQEVGVRALHYSNAGLKKPNDGVVSYALLFRLSF